MFVLRLSSDIEYLSLFRAMIDFLKLTHKFSVEHLDFKVKVVSDAFVQPVDLLISFNLGNEARRNVY